MKNVVLEIDDLAKIGAIQDEPGYQLAPEAWTTSINMRDRANGVELIGGQTQVFGSGALSDAPTFVQYLSGPTQDWWLWAANTKIFVWDGTTNNNITRMSGAYNATDAKQWNGTVFGGIPILNNGIDKPQFWSSYNAGTLMQDMTNWPASTTARVIRSFLSYLIALNVTASGTNTPHLIRWSTEASPGNLPPTWDFTDATQDAGQEDLPDVTSGVIVDGGELNGQFYVYKQSAVWRMYFVGGNFIFGFRSFLTTAGMLATRCLATTGDGIHHVFASQDDILAHNGIQAQSLLTNRYRKYLFNLIDQNHFDESFMWTNPIMDEVWFCFPLSGSQLPNHALIWNYKYNTLREADSGICTFQSASIGNVPSSTGLTWAGQTLNWSQDTQPWGGASRRRIVVTNQTSRKLLQFDSTTMNDGAGYTGTLERDALSIIGRKRTGEWIDDLQRRKLIRKLWPKLTRGTVNIQVGYQAVSNGAITWGPVQSFDPNVRMWVDGVQGSGRAVAIKFYSQNDWRLDGYKLEMALLGQF